MLSQLAALNITKENMGLIKELSEPKPRREVSPVVHRTIFKRGLINAFKESIMENLPPYTSAEGMVILRKKAALVHLITALIFILSSLPYFQHFNLWK